jgi:transposase
MTDQRRRQWSAEEKLRIIEEGRQASSTISEVCRRYSVATGQFYAWEKLARQGALDALREGKRGRKKDNPTAQREVEIQRLQAVVTELSVENLALKRGRWP